MINLYSVLQLLLVWQRGTAAQLPHNSRTLVLVNAAGLIIAHNLRILNCQRGGIDYRTQLHTPHHLAGTTHYSRSIYTQTTHCHLLLTDAVYLLVLLATSARMSLSNASPVDCGTSNPLGPSDTEPPAPNRPKLMLPP